MGCDIDVKKNFAFNASIWGQMKGVPGPGKC